MKEFIKENKESFLEYIKFVEEKEKEIKQLEEEITYKKALVMSKNICTLEKPYEEIEKKKDKIQELSEKFISLGMERDQKKINKSFKVKTEIDFDYEIEVKKLEKEKQEIQDEIDDIIEECRNKLKFKEIQDEIESKKIDMLKLIQQKIDSKKEVVNNILERREKTIPKLQSEIQEIKETLLSIKNRNFGEDADLKDIQNKTIQRLERQIEEKEIKLKDDKETFNSALIRNKEEINQLEKLKADVKEKNIKDIVYEALGYEIKEKNTEEKTTEEKDSQELIKENEDVKETQKFNNFKPVPEDRVGVWTKDGPVWIPENEEKKENKSLIHKFINALNKLKSKFTKNGKESTYNSGYMVEENEGKIDFSKRISDGIKIEKVNMDKLSEKDMQREESLEEEK